MVRTAAAVVFVAGLAQAANTPPPSPLNSQLGKLNFPVTCKIYGLLNQTFNTVFTATAPVYGGSGQQIYYTDVSGLIDVPAYITTLAPLIKAKQASANVTVNLRLTNAQPSSLVAYQDQIHNITFAPLQDAMIRIPVGNGTLAPIGPVTLGQPDVAHRIFLGDVDVSLNLEDDTGNKVFGPIPVHCGAQNIDYVIGSVNVDSTTQGVQKPTVGYIPDFQPTPFETESGYFRFPYNCNFGPLGQQNLDLTIGGTIPTYFKPGQQFTLSNSNSFLRVPPSLVTLAKQAFPSVNSFQTNITDFEVLFTNASPASFNAAKTPLISNVQVPASTGAEFIIPVPSDGFLTVGPVTAGADGSIVSVAVGTAQATTNLLDASGKSLFSFPVTCNVPAPLELIGVPVTSQKPGNYKLGLPFNGSS